MAGSPSVGEKQIQRKNWSEEPLAVTSSIRVRANATASSAPSSSPTKRGRPWSKKRQKLEEASKSSRCISHYFVKSQTTKESQAPESSIVISDDDADLERRRQQQHSPVALEGESVAMEPVLQDAMLAQARLGVTVIDEDDHDEDEVMVQQTSELNPQSATE